MLLRPYHPKRDRTAIYRLWQETGWISPGKEEVVRLMVEHGPAMVAEIDGQAECLVTTVPGTVRYLDQNLPFSGVGAVATSRIARGKGLAKRLTALAVAADASAGALVSGLGVFEQGFYDQLGFGTGSYEHVIAFDPTHLKVRKKARVPRRITPDDWQMVHASRLARLRGHGSCNLTPPEGTYGEMLRVDNSFGLGYCDGPDGELTHHFWCQPKAVEHGPYFVSWMAFQTVAQFQELMALIKSLGDQVHLVWMREPQGIQMQDMLLHPLRDRATTRQSALESGIRAMADWQMRICDLPACLAQTHLPAGEVRFNLHLGDPIAPFLDENAPWRGIAGDYVVTLGPASGAERGTDATLPALTASVGAFTRMWLGVRPATGLAFTDDLAGPPDLLEQLDQVLRLPSPKPGWEF